MCPGVHVPIVAESSVCRKGLHHSTIAPLRTITQERHSACRGCRLPLLELQHLPLLPPAVVWSAVAGC